jgi:Putative Flp pilus-assembly TadE/G-like
VPPSSGTTTRAEGQILALFAVTVVAIFIGMALVFDVGNLLIQRRMAQDAADGGALAGAQALVQGASDPTIRDTIKSFGEGTSGPWGTTVTVTPHNYYVDATGVNVGAIGSGMPNPVPVGIHVEITRSIPATFSRLIGIKQLTATGFATGAAGVGPVDVMLALDTTGSMGSTGFNAEQNAVHDFVQAMNMVKGDPKSVRVGMARFQGAVCGDTNPGGVDSTVSCSGGSAPFDDATVLSTLTDDPDTLMTIACGPAPSVNCPNDYSGAIACSTLKLPLPLANDGSTKPLRLVAGSATTSPGTVAPYGCPLNYIGKGPDCQCLPGPVPQPAATTVWTEQVGTKLANAFNVMQGNLTGQPGNSYWGWTDATRPTARPVLVMMTDGQDNSPMAATPATIAATALTLKSNVKGNVTIYTVGYYDSGISNIADAGAPIKCPGPTYPPVGIIPSATDNLMHDLSSSGINDCQYYAPLLKADDNLPAAFLKIAGRIQAGRLTN